jgi:hypothetical protein
MALDKYRYVVVEGPIGVGKTSLAQALGLRIGARIVLEDTDGNPFIARFYQDPEKYAFPVQLYFLLTRYNQQRALAQQDLFSQTTVSDYLFAKDRIFSTQNLAPDELALYDNVYRLLDERMAKPSLVIFMSARAEVRALWQPTEPPWEAYLRVDPRCVIGPCVLADVTAHALGRPAPRPPWLWRGWASVGRRYRELCPQSVESSTSPRR